MAVLAARELRKTYTDVTAVDGISFEISKGTCFGLLGPNGAGKTTTVEMLEGITRPTSGSIEYQGQPLSADFSHDAGIMFQSTALPDFMTVREALVMFGSFYQRTQPLERLIEQCALHEFLDRDNRTLSGGQKQRLLLAIALVNDPEVLFLDEPTTGLDPQARRALWALLESIKADGKTIVLTTHYMEEASLLCDELLFIDHGKIIAQGQPRDLLSDRFDDVILEIPLSDCAQIPESNAFQQVRTTKALIEIRSTDVNSSVEELLHSGVSLTRLQMRSRNLEDLFLELTGEELRA
ncbi:MAG: ABC transporter ATP-binding protein [Gammaproteobacteria bacterium]|nr:ABC transporter ATP-binding protein [Gammaproteobacteria bacterium]